MGSANLLFFHIHIVPKFFGSGLAMTSYSTDCFVVPPRNDGEFGTRNDGEFVVRNDGEFNGRSPNDDAVVQQSEAITCEAPLERSYR